jgi:OOP family OmpA-OmpF porin
MNMENDMIGPERLKLAVAALTLGLLLGASALAQEGLYSGIFGGVSMVDMGSSSGLRRSFFGNTPVDSSSLDDSDTAYGVHVGYRWNSYVATELGYVNLGEGLFEANLSDPAVVSEPTVFSARFRTTGITAAMLGIFPVAGMFDFHGRAGVYYADTRYRQRQDFTTSDTFLSGESKANSFDALAGIGAAWNFNENYSLRVEYQKFLNVGDKDDTGEVDVDLLTIGVLFR